MRKPPFLSPKGQTSDLVKSSYGFHIIHVEDKQDAHVKSFDEVRAQIEPLVKQQKTSKLLEEQANALLTSVRSDGFEKTAAAKGLNVVNTDFVAKGDPLPGIGVSPPVHE